MHASNVQVFAMDSVMDGVSAARKKKKMKIKRKRKRKKRKEKHSEHGSAPPSPNNPTPSQEPFPVIKVDGPTFTGDYLLTPGDEQSPWTDGSDMSPLPSPSPDASPIEDFCEIKGNENSSMAISGLDLVHVEVKDASESKIACEVEENAAPNPEVVRPDMNWDDEAHKSGEQLLPGDGKKSHTVSEVSSQSTLQRVEKVSTEVSSQPCEAREEKALIIANIPQLPKGVVPETETDTVVIAEHGGEQIVGVLPSVNEIADEPGGQDSNFEDNQIETETPEDAVNSEGSRPHRVVNKLSKERTEGMFGQSKLTPTHKTSSAAIAADYDNLEVYDTHTVVKSGVKVDDMNKLDFNFAKRAEEMSNAFRIGDHIPTSQQERSQNELDGVQQKRLVKNTSTMMEFGESEISKHYTHAEMSTLDDVDAAKRKNDLENLMTVGFKKKKSSLDLGTEIDGRTRYRKESILRKMKEIKVKKTVNEKDLKVDVGVKDRMNMFLAKVNQPENFENRKRNVSAYVARKTITGNAHSKYINSVKRNSSRTVTGKPPSPLKRKSSRPRLSAKRESWRRESETELKVGDQRTLSETDLLGRNYTEYKTSPKSRRKTAISPKKARLKASEIQKSKLKAAQELASKESYPYGPNAAKMIEMRRSKSDLTAVNENESGQKVKTEE